MSNLGLHGKRSSNVISGFRTTEVIQRTGLSRRQLAYWDKKGWFKPSILGANGRGSSRVYSLLDVIQLKVLKKLIEGGLSGKYLEVSLKYLKEHVSDTALASGSFLVASKRVLMVADPTKAVDLARKGQLVWLIGLDAIAEEVRKAARRPVTLGTRKARPVPHAESDPVCQEVGGG